MMRVVSEAARRDTPDLTSAGAFSVRSFARYRCASACRVLAKLRFNRSSTELGRARVTLRT